MKICQLAAVDFTLYHFLLPLMNAMRNHGYEVVGVCAKGPLATKIEEQGFQIENIDFRRNYDLVSHVRAYRQLVALFRRERFDIVHVHTPVAALIGRLAAARAGVPMTVYTAHGFYFHEHQYWLIRWLFIALEWIGGRFTDVLFTQAQEDAEAARRYGLCRGGVIEAIGNGVDAARFHPASDDDADRLALRSELDAATTDVVVLMVGRMVAEKGYPELFEAMAKIDAHLWIVGERLESDHAASIDVAIEKVTADPAQSSRTKFFGYRDDVEKLMRAADIFVLPSHREGMPRSIIEAMMTGLPVVATDIRGCREEVIDGETGILVPIKSTTELHKALSSLVNESRLRAITGQAGRKRAAALYDEKFVIDRQLQFLTMRSGDQANDA